MLRELRDSLSALGEEGVDWIPLPGPDLQPAAAAAHVEVHEDPQSAGSPLLRVRDELGDCQRCGLCETRNQIVFGEGNPNASVVFIGEGPGADEDRTGRPFVGKAGELLTKMIGALGWTRDDVYICNIVKCRPPQNRDPKPDEIDACRPFLDKQLAAIGPRAIVTLGKPASSTLLGRNVAITRERGVWQEFNGIPLMPTFHPAYVLRQYTKDVRGAVWSDLQAVRERAELA